MKILLLVNHLNKTDGWSRYGYDLAENLVALGHDVDCAVSVKSPQASFKQHVIFDSPLKLLANPLRSFFVAQKLKKIIKDTSPNIIHVVVEPYASVLPFLKTTYPVKFFLTLHGTYACIPKLFARGLRRKISLFIFTKAFKKVTKFIAVSNFTKNNFLESWGAFKREFSPVAVITNGINLSEFSSFKNGQTKANNGIKEIITVGVVRPRKGILQAIEALHHYAANYSRNFVFRIIGNAEFSPEYVSILRKKVEEYNLQDNVVFEGKISEELLHERYKKADLYIMLPVVSHRDFEGFGLVYLEANAYGVPCIGAHKSGVQEAIRDGVSGYLVDPNDFYLVASKINNILNEGSIKTAECKKWAQEHNIQSKVEEILSIYQNSENDKS